MEAKKVSVIIPVYNVEPYLRECLDSVVGQTLKDIEILCVNDGSTDNSGAILAEYAARDERITVITQDPCGVSAARNAGLDRATGKYIYFLDSDDYIDLDALERLYDRAEALRVDALFFDFVNFNDGVEGKLWQLVRKEYPEVCSGITFLKKLRDDEAYSVTVMNMLINHAFLRSADLDFYEGIIHEDHLFMSRLLMQAKRVSHMGYKLYHRRLRPLSITTKPVSEKNIYGHIITIQEMLKYGLLNENDEQHTYEIGRTIAENQRDAKQYYRQISKDGTVEISFGKSFAQYLYRHFVVEAVEMDDTIAELRTQLDGQNSENEQLRGEINRQSAENEQLRGVISQLNGDIARQQDEIGRLNIEGDRLDRENERLSREIDRLREVNSRQCAEVAAANERAAEAERSASAGWREVDAIRSSATYSIGRTITWLPRKMRGFVRCWREHGGRYTCKRVMGRLFGKNKSTTCE